MRLIVALRRSVRKVYEYNIFDNNSTDVSVIYIQRWSSRLYILLLGLAMVILLFYTTLNISSNQIKINNPSLVTYLKLHAQHPNIQCPCSQVSTSYDQFMQLSPSYHQVCSSDFVSEKWINFLFDNNQTTSRYAADFRATASHQFQVLRQFCQLSIAAMANGLQQLYSSQLISGQLFNQDLFKAQVEADILAFERITASNFLEELTLVRSLMFGNQLMPAIETAFTIIVRSDTPGVIRSSPGVNTDTFVTANGSGCGCTDYSSCHMPAGFYDVERVDTSGGVFDQERPPPREYVSGWNTGCWPSETLLLSTLEHAYNQTELNRICSYFNSSTTRNLFRALNASQNSSFAVNTNVEDLVEELFVEMLTKDFNYTSYFQKCQPDTCTYDVNQRASILYIITSLLGLYGGLSVVLFFAAPYIGTFVVNHCQKQQQVNPPVEDVERIDFSQRLRQPLATFWHLLVDLNLFKSTRKITGIDQQRQRWSTRLYLLLLTMAILFLTLYTWLNVDSKLIQIQNPSLTTVSYLQSHFSSLQCPCTELSSSYEDLIDLEPTYHQICSSEFITSKWIDGLNQIALASVASLYYADFRFSGPIFQLLQSMCNLADDTVINALFVFGQTELVTADLLPPDLFSEQLESAIEQFKLITPNALLRLLQLTRNITYMNQFLSGSFANFDVDYSIVQEYVEPDATLEIYGSSSTLANGTSISCSCANDIECGKQAALYTGPSGHRKIIFTIPGFYSRCFPVESLLPSTLECFYSNQGCLQSMANVTNETFFTTITPLNGSQASRFMMNSTINTLLEELFIESWSSTLFYSSYFSQCQPAICSYTIITRKSTLEIVTILTGLLGGLSIVLRIVVPYLISACVKLIQRHRVAPVQNANNISQFNAVREKLRAYVAELNMFEKTHRTVISESELHLQRQSTRVYFLLLASALFILVAYTSLVYNQDDHTVKISSLAKLQYLQTLYGSTTVQCPCTKLSFYRTTFQNVEPVFHQVCSSDLISAGWLDTLFESYENQNLSDFNSYTFISTAFAYFQSLRIMCDLNQQAVIDARDLFLATKIVSAYIIDYDLFNSQTTADLTNFQSTLPNSFVHILNMLLGMAQGNGLVSGYSTNWGLFLPNMTKDATIYTKPRIYGGCSCATSISCAQPSIPYVPGFSVGCLPLESFLQSTFECLYNQSCVNTISSYVNASIVPKALNYTNTRFAWNLPANSIVQEMFIESWSTNISYEQFFEQCQPTSCSYTLVSRNNILFVITTIVGLYGGLTVFLKLVVPFVVDHLHAMMRRTRHPNIQVVPIEERY